MAAPPVHEALADIAWILGEWSGPGCGKYPTIKDFTYLETVTFTHAGKPVISYIQKTRKQMEDGTPGPPMHAESGFLRPSAEGGWEWVLAQASGLVEVQKGHYDQEAGKFTFKSSLVGNAQKVGEIGRILEHVQEGEDAAIKYVVSMSTKTQPMQEHLAATLKRVKA